MFEQYVTGRTDPRGRWRSAAFAASALMNAGAIGGLLFWSFWQIERLQGKSTPVTFLVAPSPPPPPPPAAAPPPPAAVARPRVVTPRELVQPVPAPEEPPAVTPSEPAGEPGSGDGQPGGVAGGDPASTGGTPGGTGAAPTVEEAPPVNIPMEGVEAQRIAGTRDIPLPPAVKLALVSERKFETVAHVKLCLSAGGVPVRVEVMRSTGYPEADERIRSEVKTWRYRPFRVNGQPVPVCTAVMFRYKLE